MSVVDDRHETDRDIEEVFGLNPEFFQRVPDFLLATEWASFVSLDALRPDRHPQQVQGTHRPGGLRRDALSLLRVLPPEAARLFGATEDEITEASLVAKHTMGWSTT